MQIKMATGLGLGLAIIAGAALAAGPMDNTYGNTVKTVNKADQAVGYLYFESAGTFTSKATGEDGKEIAGGGTWMTKDADATICLTPELPAEAPADTPQPATTCSPLSTHNVGDTWEVTNDAGDTFEVTLSAGR